MNNIPKYLGVLNREKILKLFEIQLFCLNENNVKKNDILYFTRLIIPFTQLFESQKVFWKNTVFSFH